MRDSLLLRCTKQIGVVHSSLHRLVLAPQAQGRSCWLAMLIRKKRDQLISIVISVCLLPKPCLVVFSLHLFDGSREAEDKRIERETDCFLYFSEGFYVCLIKVRGKVQQPGVEVE